MKLNSLSLKPEAIYVANSLINRNTRLLYSKFDFEYCENFRELIDFHEVSSKLNDFYSSYNNICFIPLADPTTLLGDFLYDFFSNANFHEIISNKIRSSFQIFWFDCYRTLPSDSLPGPSWYWHIDNVPQATIKGMLLLNDVAEKNGPMELFNKSQTLELRKNGYTGNIPSERKQEISDYFKNTDIVTPIKITGKRGDLILFDNNLLHKAVLPKSSYRDVITFLIAPGRKSQQIRLLSKRYIAHISKKPGGFPLNPFR